MWLRAVCCWSYHVVARCLLLGAFSPPTHSMARHSELSVARSQAEPGGARGARRSQEQPGGARRSQGGPGGAGRTFQNSTECLRSLRKLHRALRALRDFITSFSLDPKAHKVLHGPGGTSRFSKPRGAPNSPYGPWKCSIKQRLRRFERCFGFFQGRVGGM